MTRFTFHFSLTRDIVISRTNRYWASERYFQYLSRFETFLKIRKIDIPNVGERVDVFALDLRDFLGQTVSFSTLSHDELNRIARFRYEEDGRRFGIIRSHLRLLIANRLNIDPREINFTVGSYGKPSLLEPARNPHALQFNISHSGDIALFAFSIDQAVGIDVEQIRPVHDVDQIVNRVFSPVEQQGYSELPASQRILGFFNCWTRKEAFVKASGFGLEYPLKSFDVSLHPNEEACILHIGVGADRDLNWTIASFSPQPCYIASLVTVCVK